MDTWWMKTSLLGGPVVNRPSNDYLYKFVQKKKKKNCIFCMWHMTCDMWHATCSGRQTFFQNFSSLALTALEIECFEDIWKKKDEWLMNLLIIHKGVCRTAPAVYTASVNKAYAYCIKYMFVIVKICLTPFLLLSVIVGILFLIYCL